MKDEEIVDLYWRRSERAIEESRKKHGAFCRSIAFRILHNREDSEECENDTYLRSWNAIPPSRPKLLGAFLGKITRNLALDRLSYRDALKRGGGEIPVVLNELTECVPDYLHSVGESDALVKVLERFLESLSKESRIIFVQRYWFGCSISEITEANDIGASKAKMKLKRLRDKLKDMLEKEGAW